ncbi:MAG TPA: helix-turn-helix domain-containing protein, partial [Myxococcota bacterium]|nr:helix-turn-helix domain-containing protein [Myxococcota bacterium]
RERPEDVLRLARAFLAFFDRAANRRAQTLSPDAERALAGYAWPGNVRELRNAMERCAILWPGDVVEPAALPERIVGAAHAGPRVGGDVTIDALEREHVARVLARAATLEEAARTLGIDESTLWRKRKRYGL